METRKVDATDKQLQALKDIAFIKEMMVESKKKLSSSSPYFILWGIIWIIGFGAEAIGFKEQALGWTWMTLSIIGWIGTMFFITVQKKKEPLPAYATQYLPIVGLGVLAVFAVFVLLFVIDALNPKYLNLYIILIVALMYIQMSIVFGKELIGMGLWLIVLSGITAVWLFEYQAIIFSLLGGGSLVGTGLILRRWRRSNE